MMDKEETQKKKKHHNNSSHDVEIVKDDQGDDCYLYYTAVAPIGSIFVKLWCPYYKPLLTSVLATSSGGQNSQSTQDQPGEAVWKGQSGQEELLLLSGQCETIDHRSRM
jgi:hypothetical protein